MKKFLLIVIIIIGAMFSLLGCSSKKQADNKISDYKWRLESISDLEGKIIAKNPEQAELADTQYDMELKFNEDHSFFILNKTTKEELKGVYTLEKTAESSSYKLSLSFDEEEEEYIGVYGIRRYYDENKQDLPSVIFQREDKIYSFLAYE